MKLSLGRKIVILIISVAVLLIAVCITVSGFVVRSMMEKEYMITADSMAGTVAQMTDGDRLERITDKVMERYYACDNKVCNTDTEDPAFKDYQAVYLDLTEDEDYIAVRDQLRKIQDVSEVDCVYTLFIVPEDKTCVYIVDAAHEDIVTPGCFDMVEESCYPYLSDLSQGFPAFITDTEEYGWVATSCMPIYNSKGELVCFSAVDLSMTDILGKIKSFIFMLAAILTAMTVIICVLAILYVKMKIVRPLNMLSKAADQYGQKVLKEAHHEFGSLDIKTGDEIEVLLRSMVKMENDIDSYIENLTMTREQLSTARQEADDMNVLAHKDALTGIRNKLAYDKETAALDSGIAEGMKEFGIAMIDLNSLKYINDTYGHECGNKAIKLLSKTVCEIFAHSPVFRIGGDEFAVILRRHDYENIVQLQNDFESRLIEFADDETLYPWDKISAALGYALFDERRDHCAEDVFKRADEAMYERKKEMKADR